MVVMVVGRASLIPPPMPQDLANSDEFARSTSIPKSAPTSRSTESVCTLTYSIFTNRSFIALAHSLGTLTTQRQTVMICLAHIIRGPCVPCSPGSER